MTILWNGSKFSRAVGVWESWASLYLYNTLSGNVSCHGEQCKYETSSYKLLEFLQDLVPLFNCFLFWILVNRPWKVFCRGLLKKPTKQTKHPQTKTKNMLPFQAVHIVYENSNSGPGFSSSFDCSASEVCTGELYFQTISSQHLLKLRTLYSSQMEQQKSLVTF